MKNKMPPLTPEYINNKRKASDKKLLDEGATMEGDGKIILKAEQIDKIRKEMEEDMGLVEKYKDQENPKNKIIETKDADGDILYIEYDDKGRIKTERSDEIYYGGSYKHGIYFEGYLPKKYRKDFEYYPDGSLKKLTIREPYLDKEYYYDEEKKEIMVKWTTRRYKDLQTEEMGQIDYKYEKDEKGRIVNKVGNGKTTWYSGHDSSYILDQTLFYYDDENNMIAESNIYKVQHVSGPMSGQIIEKNSMLIKQFDDDGKIISEMQINDGDNGEERKITQFIYDDKKLINKVITSIVDGEVVDQETITIE